MHVVGKKYYRGYGTDDFGRTGVFETSSKEEILRYSKKAVGAEYIEEILILKHIPINEHTQLTLFDLE